ncbi:WD40 repeat-like protein, partial [Coniophora puteana RWD-64-598 SS2]
AVKTLAWSSNGRQLFTAGEGYTIRKWATKTGEASLDVYSHFHRIQSFDISHDCSLVVGSTEHAVHLWDANTTEIFAIPMERKHAFTRMVKLTPDASRILVGASSQYNPEATDHNSGYSIEVWDIKSGRLIHTIWGHTHPISAFSVSQDGSRFASASAKDGYVRLWDAYIGALVRSMDHESDVLSAAFSSDGSHIATGTLEGYIRIWDRATGKLVLGEVGPCPSMI